MLNCWINFAGSIDLNRRFHNVHVYLYRQHSDKRAETSKFIQALKTKSTLKAKRLSFVCTFFSFLRSSNKADTPGTTFSRAFSVCHSGKQWVQPLQKYINTSIFAQKFYNIFKFFSSPTLKLYTCLNQNLLGRYSHSFFNYIQIH